MMFRHAGLILLILCTGRSAADAEPPRQEVLSVDAAAVTAATRHLESVRTIAKLAELEHWQEVQGGGFYGLLPSPVPDHIADLAATDPAGAAAALAESRQRSRVALTQIGFPMIFRDQQIPQAAAPSPPGQHVELDSSVVAGFLQALADDMITPDEARTLATLPANREMLRHRRELGYVPDPLPDEISLARMIEHAGSSDPVDRMWRWLSPANFFGYADLAEEAGAYRRMQVEVDRHGSELEAAAALRIAPYLPAGFEYHERFALTVGSLIRGWATSEMAGLNVEQLKDDWPRLLRTMTEEVYHRLQLRLLPSPSEAPATDFDELSIHLDDARYNALYDALLYTVVEGSANLVAGPSEGVDDAARAKKGASLLNRLVETVIAAGDTDAADALINEGLRSNGPLYALGYRMAVDLQAAHGAGAIPALLQQGPVVLALEAAHCAPAGETLLTPRVIKELEALDAMLGDRTGRSNIAATGEGGEAAERP